MLRVLVGAGHAAEATIAAAAVLMPHACILSAYGMTEATSSITFNTLVSPASMLAPGAPGAANKICTAEQLRAVATPKWAGVTQTGAPESHCVGTAAPGFQLAIEMLTEDVDVYHGLSDGSDCALVCSLLYGSSGLNQMRFQCHRDFGGQQPRCLMVACEGK